MDYVSRERCSGTVPSEDTYGVWALVRAEAAYDEYTQAELDELEEAYFGSDATWTDLGEDADMYCVEDDFADSGAWDAMPDLVSDSGLSTLT